MPSKEFVQRMWTIYRFVEFALKKLHNTRKTREDLISFLTPHITGCSTFCCTRGKKCLLETSTMNSLQFSFCGSSLIQCLMDTQQHNLICRQRPLLLAIIKLSIGNLIHIPNNNIYFSLPLLTEKQCYVLGVLSSQPVTTCYMHQKTFVYTLRFSKTPGITFSQ